MIRTAIFTYLLALATVVSPVKAANSDAGSIKAQSADSAIVFVGDSRTVGMKAAVSDVIDDSHEFFIAKAGEGYSWLKNTGISSLKNTVASNSDITNWSIVTNLGVNDLDDAEKYVDTYKNVVNSMNNGKINVTMYVVSINPVDENKCHSITNSDVDRANEVFAASFSGNGNIRYIDSNTYVGKIMSSSDGLHYSDGTYLSIYRYILKSIKGWQKADQKEMF